MYDMLMVNCLLTLLLALLFIIVYIYYNMLTVNLAGNDTIFMNIQSVTVGGGFISYGSKINSIVHVLKASCLVYPLSKLSLFWFHKIN